MCRTFTFTFTFTFVNMRLMHTSLTCLVRRVQRLYFRITFEGQGHSQCGDKTLTTNGDGQDIDTMHSNINKIIILLGIACIAIKP